MATRGRPSCDDSAILRKVAAKLTADPGQKARSAIIQCLSLPSEANVRRLQRKWRASGSAYLAEARERLTRRRVQDIRIAAPVYATFQLEAELTSWARRDEEMRRVAMEIQGSAGSAAEAFRSSLAAAQRQMEMIGRILGKSPFDKTMSEVIRMEKEIREISAGITDPWRFLASR